MADTAERPFPTPPPWREAFSGARGRLTLGLLLLEALVAIEALIVTTILPAVQRDLGGLKLYGWTFTAFTLASLGTVPIAGRFTDRLGPRTVLGATLAIYVAGLAIAAAAPSMPVLVAARFVQGVGGGGLYTVSLGTVAKTYPERIRPRVLALLASMWILPGLAGPPLGAILASTIGWRWAFLVPLPAIALATALILPALRGVAGHVRERAPLPVAACLLLMVGAGAFLAGLTDLSWRTSALIPIGLGVGLPALRRITPRGTMLARPGLPAAAAAAFLASAAFFAVDGFITLMLTEVRGRSVGEAGIVVTLASVAWAAGSWWQSRSVQRLGARTIVVLGAAVIGVASLIVAAGLAELPLWIPYAGWTLGGLGMGTVFPTIPLAVMSAAPAGSEAGELSGMILMDYLGVGVGAGLGGASVALAAGGAISLEAGIAGAFAIGLVAAAMLALVGLRLPGARPVDSAT